MNLDRFQPPSGSEQLAAERETERLYWEDRAEAEENFTMNTTYIPPFRGLGDIWLAWEPRVQEKTVVVAKDGLFPGYRRTNGTCELTYLPAHHKETIRWNAVHVMGVGSTEREALEMAGAR